MKKFYILILISLLGLGYGIFEVIKFEKPAVKGAKAIPLIFFQDMKNLFLTSS